MNSSLFLGWPWQDAVLSAGEEPCLQVRFECQGFKGFTKEMFSHCWHEETGAEGTVHCSWQGQQGGIKDSSEFCQMEKGRWGPSWGRNSRGLQLGAA